MLSLPSRSPTAPSTSSLSVADVAVHAAQRTLVALADEALVFPRRLRGLAEQLAGSSRQVEYVYYDLRDGHVRALRHPGGAA